MTDTNLSNLAKIYFEIVDKRFGPFDRPLQFRPFPFEVGGALNFLTIGAGKGPMVTYVTWDLIGQRDQRRGKLGRYELLTMCDNEEWVLDIITNIGRQTLSEVFDSGDTMDISPWSNKYSSELTGILFEEAFVTEISVGLMRQKCSLLRCIGITNKELEFARTHTSRTLIDRLKSSNVYPKTIFGRSSIDL
jgi:hypothetical protein